MAGDIERHNRNSGFEKKLERRVCATSAALNQVRRFRHHGFSCDAAIEKRRPRLDTTRMPLISLIQN